MSLKSENPSAEITLDKTDQKILALLQENCKMGNKEIAAAVGLSVTPTFERIRRMERHGVIKGYSAKLDKKAIGKGLLVLCQVSLKAHNIDVIKGFEDSITLLDEVSHCFHIAGDYDYLLQIETRDMEAYQSFLKTKLATIANIANVQSSFVMSTLK
jgi:Lrp/AsnC family transcriptional regulator, leucine-responsive regulatory protein